MLSSGASAATKARTAGRSAPTASTTAASAATGSHAPARPRSTQVLDSPAGAPTTTADNAWRAAPTETELNAPGTSGPNISPWSTRTLVARSTRNRRSSRPLGSLWRPSATSSTTTHVAPTARWTVVVARWSDPATDTVGSNHNRRCPPAATEQRVVDDDQHSMGAGHTMLAATDPTSARASGPTSTINSSSSPPTGAAADAASRTRSPQRRTLIGA